MAFNAKNLHYEKQEPAFLRRLKGANDAADGRQNVQIARPKKERLKTGDDGEDDPVILDENGQIVNKAEFEGMQKGEPSKDVDTITPNDTPGDARSAQEDEHDRIRGSQHIAEVRGPKKRKQARAIGGESEDEDKSRPVPLDKNNNAATISQSKSDDQDQNKSIDKPKVKKKAKKIKLSFDDPE